MKTYRLIISDDLMREIKIHCAKNDKTIKQVIVESVEETLKKCKSGTNE